MEKHLTPDILEKLRNIAQSNDFCLTLGTEETDCTIVHYRSFMENQWVIHSAPVRELKSPTLIIGQNEQELWDGFEHIGIEDAKLVKIDLFRGKIDWINGGEIQPLADQHEKVRLCINKYSHAPVEKKNVKFPFSTKISLQPVLKDQFLHVDIQIPDISLCWEECYCLKFPESMYLNNPQPIQQSFEIKAVPSWGKTDFEVITEGEKPQKVSIPEFEDSSKEVKKIHLYIIFDRTTTDKESWVKVRDFLRYSGTLPQLQLPEVQEDLKYMGEDDSDASSEQKPDPSQWNKTLREFLFRGFKENIQKLALNGKFTFCWFADTVPGGWIDMREIATSPPWGKTNERDFSEWNPDILSTYTYLPGMDIFDPVEEALCMTLEDIEFRGVENGCILIIGNSPPTLPMDPKDPLRKLIISKETKRATSNVRDTSVKWQEGLQTCQNESIPFCYLFIKMDGAPIPPEYSKDAKIYYTRIKQTYSTFESDLIPYLGKSVEYNAGDCGNLIPTDPDNLGIGLQDALNWLVKRLQIKDDRIWVKMA